MTETGEVNAQEAGLLRISAIIVLLGAIAFWNMPSCSDGPKKRNLAVEKLMMENMAKDRVRTLLRDPQSAEFSLVEAYPGPVEYRGTVCGYVNSRNGFGGMTGPQQFIVTNKVMLAEQVPITDMVIAWAEECG